MFSLGSLFVSSILANVISSLLVVGILTWIKSTKKSISSYGLIYG